MAATAWREKTHRLGSCVCVFSALFALVSFKTCIIFVNVQFIELKPNCCTSIIWVGVGCVVCERERGSVCVCVYVRGVKPLSLADGHTEGGLTQEQWGPLTKTTPPRHVASCHRGNPPWDRERGDSWRGGLTKMESISFHWSSLSSISFPLFSRASSTLWPWWMQDTSHFTAPCDWPYRLDLPPTNPPEGKINKLRIRANNKSALYWLSLLSVIRAHWASLTNMRLSHKISHSLCSWFYASF